MKAINEELAKACEQLEAKCDVALLSSKENVTYVSGFEVPHGVGVVEATTYASPFAVFPVRDSSSWLAVSIFESAKAERESRLDHLSTFAAFENFKESDPARSYLDLAETMLRQAGLSGAGKLGVEARALPNGLAEFISEAFPNVKLIEIGDVLRKARFIKTTREIGLLRRAVQIGDIGQRTLAVLVRSGGRSEFEMYSQIGWRMCEGAGHMIPISGELVSGSRAATNIFPAGPSSRITEVGDPVRMDISQRIDGSWSDVTNTHLVGGTKPNQTQERYARAAQAGFEAAVERLRPGRLASDVWEAAEAAYGRFGLHVPHNVGHQIGVTVNELPRLVPYDHTVIEPDMVFAVELGAYQGPGGEFGSRFEKDVLVTESGPKILSQFEWGI